MWVEASNNIYNIAERLDSLEGPFKMNVEREVYFLSLKRGREGWRRWGAWGVSGGKK